MGTRSNTTSAGARVDDTTVCLDSDPGAGHDTVAMGAEFHTVLAVLPRRLINIATASTGPDTTTVSTGPCNRSTGSGSATLCTGPDATAMGTGPDNTIVDEPDNYRQHWSYHCQRVLDLY